MCKSKLKQRSDLFLSWFYLSPEWSTEQGDKFLPQITKIQAW